MMTVQARKRRSQYIAISLVLAAGYPLILFSGWEGNPSLHTLMEAMATLLAVGVGTLLLVRYYSKKNNQILLIGAGFLGTAFLEGFHAVVTSEFFKSIYPSPTVSLAPWSWFASRFFLSVIMLLSLLLWQREKRRGEGGQVLDRHVYLAIGLLTSLSCSFFSFVPLPPAYYPDLFFARPEEFIPAFFFLLALAGYLRRGLWREDPFEHWLIIFLIVSFLSEALYMASSSRLFDSVFDAAHFLKKLSYICVFFGYITAMSSLFKEAEEGRYKIEKVNRELDSFVYTASHDLRAPLRGISSFATFLEEDYKDKMDDQGKDYIKEIQRGVKRMIDLIEDLLTLSRISRVQNPFEETDINKVIHSVVERIEFDIAKAGVNLNIHEKMPAVYCDRIKIAEVFANLITNAIKFAAKNQDPEIEIGYEEKKNVHQFFVKDNGIGIDPKHHSQIFGIFKRLHTQKEIEGTGAGLSIVKRVMDDHRGNIWVKSGVGKGACFYFTIPKNLRRINEKATQQSRV